MKTREVIQGGEEMVEVTFVWHKRHGECEDCGLPAAYYSYRYHAKSDPGSLCCVCAADDAAQGITIERIDPLS